jgi:1-deoxy-D-xylulose-5-phosphate synthase
MRWAKPLDTAMLDRMAEEHVALVTLEEGALMGGAGSAVLEYLADAGRTIPVLRLGIADAFTQHGDPAKLLSQMGLDAAGIEGSIRARFADLMERARHPAVYDVSKRRAA